MSALADEFVKISVSRKGMTVAQSRKGRRPMSVSTLLRKEKDGSLFKFKTATSRSDQSRLEFQEVDPKATGKPAEPKKKKGDVPSREDVSIPVKAQERQNMRSQSIAVEHGEHLNAPDGLLGY